MGPPPQVGTPSPPPGLDAGQQGGDQPLTPNAIIQQGKQAIQQVARDIANAPGNKGRQWKHGELLAAVEMALDDQKKYFDPIAIQSAKVQLAQANAQLKYAEAIAKLAQGDRKLDQGDTKLGQGQEVIEQRGDIAAQTSSDRRYAADMTYRGRVLSAETSERNTDARDATSERNAERRGSGAGGVMKDLKLEQSLERTEVGKIYARTSQAVGEVNNLASQPDIENNPEAQWAMNNRYLYMTTGSVRPPLAEYKKILGAADGQDVYDMVTGRIPAHPIMGTDQIRNIVRASNTVANGARDRAMADPLTSATIKQIEGDLRTGGQPQASGGGGNTQPASGSPPASALKAGHDTTFANGQVWTLDAQGKPKRVK